MQGNVWVKVSSSAYVPTSDILWCWAAARAVRFNTARFQRVRRWGVGGWIVASCSRSWGSDLCRIWGRDRPTAGAPNAPFTFQTLFFILKLGRSGSKIRLNLAHFDPHVKTKRRDSRTVWLSSIHVQCPWQYSCVSVIIILSCIMIIK